MIRITYTTFRGREVSFTDTPDMLGLRLRSIERARGRDVKVEPVK
jgi:hypothetical protein